MLFALGPVCAAGLVLLVGASPARRLGGFSPCFPAVALTFWCETRFSSAPPLPASRNLTGVWSCHRLWLHLKALRGKTNPPGAMPADVFPLSWRQVEGICVAASRDRAGTAPALWQPPCKYPYLRDFGTLHACRAFVSPPAMRTPSTAPSHAELPAPSGGHAASLAASHQDTLKTLLPPQSLGTIWGFLPPGYLQPTGRASSPGASSALPCFS